MSFPTFVLKTDGLTWLSRALSLVGLMIASYLTFMYLRDAAPICIGGASHSGCLTVEQSRYAHVDGIPLPIFGMFGYLMLLLTACMKGQRARTAGMLFTVMAISASICLTYLELNVIHAVCIWCVSSATCATLHVIVNSSRYVRGEPRVAPRMPVLSA